MSEIAKTDFSAGDKLLASQLNTSGELINRAGFMNFTLGETLAINQPIYLASSNNNVNMYAYALRFNRVYNNTSSTTRFAQFFTTPSWANKLNFCVTTFTISYNYQGIWDVYLCEDNSGVPGTILASGTINVPSGNSNEPRVSYSVDFSSVTLSPSTSYCIVFKCNSSSSLFNYAEYSTDTSNLGTLKISTNSGSTYSNLSYKSQTQLYFSKNETENKIYKAKSNIQSTAELLGFNIGGGSAGDIVAVQTNGIITGLSGLTIGANYYLSDTGTLSTTKGTIGVVVGKALSSTSILLNKEIKNVATFLIPYDNVGAYSFIKRIFKVPDYAKRAEMIVRFTSGSYYKNTLQLSIEKDSKKISEVYGFFTLAGDADKTFRLRGEWFDKNTIYMEVYTNYTYDVINIDSSVYVYG